MQEASLGHDRAILAPTLEGLTRFLKNHGQREDASACYLTTLALKEGHNGPQAASLDSTLRRLAELPRSGRSGIRV